MKRIIIVSLLVVLLITYILIIAHIYINTPKSVKVHWTEEYVKIPITATLHPESLKLGWRLYFIEIELPTQGILRKQDNSSFHQINLLPDNTKLRVREGLNEYDFSGYIPVNPENDKYFETSSEELFESNGWLLYQYPDDRFLFIRIPLAELAQLTGTKVDISRYAFVWLQ